MRTIIVELSIDRKLLVAPSFRNMRHIANATKYSLPDIDFRLLLKTAPMVPYGG